MHIATAIPAPATTTILPEAGSGIFKSVPGTTRLAGAMDMSQFRARNEISFNDIYISPFAVQKVQKLNFWGVSFGAPSLWAYDVQLL